MITPQPSELDYQRVNKYFRVAIAISITVLVIGAVFYHLVEKLSWIDAVYFCAITLTTVGYGDITPHTDAGKIFTVFYIFTGIGIIGGMINLIVRRATAKQRLRHK